MTKYCKHEQNAPYADKCIFCLLKKCRVPQAKMMDVAHGFYQTIKKSYSGEGCERCGGIDEPYMLIDSMWKVLTDNTHERFLCLECAQLRCGRTLAIKHFAKVPINFGMLGFDCRAWVLSEKNKQKKAA